MNTSKPLSVALMLVLICSDIMLIQAASASVPTPSVPEFTVKFVDASYNVPTTTSTDPYTGETITHTGYHVVNRTIEVKIKNQPFTAYESNGQIINFYLNIRTKGYYEKYWSNFYSPDNGYLVQSNSSYTTVSYSLDDDVPLFWDNIQGGGTVDFQVQALIGSVHRISNGSATSILEMYPWVFDGQTSEWSSTKTVVIPEPTNSPTDGVPTTPSNIGYNQANDLILIVIVSAAVVVITVIIVAAALVKKARKTI